MDSERNGEFEEKPSDKESSVANGSRLVPGGAVNRESLTISIDRSVVRALAHLLKGKFAP